MEQTFVMIKPDGFKQKIFKDVMEMLLKNGLSIKDVNIVNLNEDFIKEHYSHLTDKPFFPHLQEFMLSGPIISITVFGENAISKVRNIMGATNPNKAEKGTIRYIYGNKEDVTCNVMHASDSKENALIELNRFNRYKKLLLKNKYTKK